MYSPTTITLKPFNANVKTNFKPRKLSNNKTTITKCMNKTSQPSSNKYTITPDTLIKDMSIGSWAPELINGRCAMIGFVSGYGYELIKNESLYQQFQEMFPYFGIVSLLITIATLKAGKPTNDDVKINGLTPEAELFNGRAAMLGVSGTILYEIMSNSLSV